MRLIDADSLLEKWNKLSESDRRRFDQTIRFETSVYDFISRYSNDDRPECCKEHEKYFSTCDTCEYGEWEEENITVDFYMGTIRREWYDDVSKKWNTSGVQRNIIVVAENKEMAKEKLDYSVQCINKTGVVKDWERYVLEEESICKTTGLLWDFQAIVRE